MSKFVGAIGYAQTVKTAPGVWTERIVEYPCCGDVLRCSRQRQSGDKVNDDINISNQLSIIDDGYCSTHIGSIRYVIWMGAKWKVTDVAFQRPRLILTVGGVYNGAEDEDRIPEDSGEDSGEQQCIFSTTRIY